MSTGSRWPLAGLCLALAACEGSPVRPDVGPPAFDFTILFNPQPEPPTTIVGFAVEGLRDGRWVGTFGDMGAGPGGDLLIETLSAEQVGETLHLVQTWAFIPPDPIAPVMVSMTGIINLATGRLVLNGEVGGGTPDDSQPVHVRGQVVDGGGGISVGGEVMFNPQPEPPVENFGFTAAGLRDGSWVGTFGDMGAGPGGDLFVETLSSQLVGGTLHVMQTWTFVPPDPIAPVMVAMTGIINLATGRLVLNGEVGGTTPDDGQPVHVRGQVVDGGGGISVGGEVMFNAQPEPPRGG